MFKGRRRSVVRGAPQAMVLEQKLLTLEIRGGLHVRQCPTQRDSVRFIQALYRYWTDKSLDEHRTHLAIHAPDADPRLRLPLSDFRRGVQILLPGIGYAASKVVEEYFGGSWRRMMMCSEADWAALEIPDRKGKVKRLGASRAQQIMEALR